MCREDHLENFECFNDVERCVRVCVYVCVCGGGVGGGGLHIEISAHMFAIRLYYQLTAQ